ncbi:MAG: hypothetical protein RBS72_02300 [Sedimentisphaerales bacterium]|nr:hypothetical protein [Sedimentisphaerales bacterium]HNY77324.1 hypothetical protein [Sedimentisphaerales bacterium]HOC62073.1 hypothetical protein [Sedimentisphaerales bacterium]HOH63540.1 hypothetical protein [Sedimentisphaerales bacterium]HPY51285.1 hypothetical protein [Sedimentisphaerales bacterium]
MRVRVFHAMGVCLLVGSPIVISVSGCSRQCGGPCTPQSPWQSPTMQATRSLLLVNTAELRILRIDGRNVRASCIGRGGVREYHIRPGEHELTASLHYAAPVGAGLIGEAYGRPLKLTHVFQPGHEYVAIYREHPYPTVQAATVAQAVAGTVLQPYEGTWSLRIVDLADVEADSEREAQQARIYGALIGASARVADQGASPIAY